VEGEIHRKGLLAKDLRIDEALCEHLTTAAI
jgi:hypothetical protein